jgi:hypothetical protein
LTTSPFFGILKIKTALIIVYRLSVIVYRLSTNEIQVIDRYQNNPDRAFRQTSLWEGAFAT